MGTAQTQGEDCVRRCELHENGGDQRFVVLAVLSKIAADCLYLGAGHVPVLVLGGLIDVRKYYVCDLHVIHRDAVGDEV